MSLVVDAISGEVRAVPFVFSFIDFTEVIIPSKFSLASFIPLMSARLNKSEAGEGLGQSKGVRWMLSKEKKNTLFSQSTYP